MLPPSFLVGSCTSVAKVSLSLSLFLLLSSETDRGTKRNRQRSDYPKTILWPSQLPATTNRSPSQNSKLL